MHTCIHTYIHAHTHTHTHTHTFDFPTKGSRYIARLVAHIACLSEAKETYYRGKRDLLQRQKRPTIEAKETYYSGKRDLL